MGASQQLRLTKDVAARATGRNFTLYMQPDPASPRSERTEVNKQPKMDEKTETGSDSSWQSIRLGLGAAFLIVGGLALMLADGNIHPSKALSSVFVPTHFAQSK